MEEIEVVEEKEEEAECSSSSSNVERQRRHGGDDEQGWASRVSELETQVEVAVAVGRSSSSSQALRWALDNLNEVSHGHGHGHAHHHHLIHLLHVQSPIRYVPTPLGSSIPIGQASPDMVNKCKLQRFVETEKLLYQYQQMCEEKEVRCEVICIEGEVVEKALVDEISRRCIPTLVLGIPSRSRLKKAFKGQAIASVVTKNAPEFCNVIVINKGRVHSKKEAMKPRLLDG